MADDTPSSLVKQNFITALRQTPDGIAGFLTAAIPEPPACSVPTDVDAAIIANGVCAAYVLDLFRPFAGLTLVELLLRIGQHNSVTESMLLAGLQYLADSQAAAEFEIVEPTEGTVFLPGELRITARARNEAVIKSIAGTLGAHTFQMKAADGLWRQYVDVAEGEQTLTLTATFAAGDPVSQTVNIIVSAEPVDPENPEDPPIEPEPPEGQDEEALSDAEDAFNQALKDFLATVNQNPVVDILLPQLQQMTNAYNVLTQITAAVESGSASQAILSGAQAALGEIQGLIAQVEDPGVIVDQISAKAGEVAGSVKAALSNIWGQLNG